MTLLCEGRRIVFGVRQQAFSTPKTLQRPSCGVFKEMFILVSGPSYLLRLLPKSTAF
ncbi:hypothetical protein SCG7086_CG_00050 [Chlamydiales bacterium SCGC AG-110-P3]|nr:hypothetical protein SCG7086_CG_00050 [Chlamydiales bacterium SCGC AG-110-P3]